MTEQTVKTPFERHTRCQGAILRDDHILLIRWHDPEKTFWMIPGGGLEPGEDPEGCVCREMREETHLDVEVVSLLLDEEGRPGGIYRRLLTYHCRIIGGVEKPGYEPEEEFAVPEGYGIVEVGWFDLRSPDIWNDLITTDPITAPFLHRLRNALGYCG